MASGTTRATGTTAALLDAAEERFAEDSFQAASLRAVMRTAGSDPGAVHYHFKDRAGLAAAVLDRILVPLNDRRLSLLDQAEARWGGVGIPLADLVEALVRPDIEAAVGLDRRGAGRARLIGAIYLDPARFVTAEVERHFGPVAQRFMPHMVAVVPDVPPEILAWRVRWCVFATVGALLADDREPGKLGQGLLIDRVVTTLAAAVAAPISDRDPVQQKGAPS